MATVLCVEDEPDLRECIAEELAEEGYEIFEARDGLEGLQMVLRHKPDIVVSDISMPRMSGLEFVEKLRTEHPERAEMPFVFLTAFNDRDDMLKGLEAGADDYLTKPVDFELLLTKVASGLRQAQRMLELKEKQQAKLYCALTKDKPVEVEQPKPTMPAHKLVLVGESNPGLWTVKQQLEDLGQHVHVFTSGRAYLNKAECIDADAIFLWLQTDDMQAPMIATMCKELDHKTIVVLPESLQGEMKKPEMNGVHDVVCLPITDADLVKQLKAWLGS